MPTWGEILKEVQASARERRPLGTGPDLDGIRLKYLKALHARSEHAVISYMSGWLQGGKSALAHSVEGQDVHGLMEVCYQVEDRNSILSCTVLVDPPKLPSRCLSTCEPSLTTYAPLFRFKQSQQQR